MRKGKGAKVETGVTKLQNKDAGEGEGGGRLYLLKREVMKQ